VAENIERVARGAEETETTSGQMLRSAKGLSEVSIHLKDEVEKFLDSVRAA
jgi:methyl-accepting chemotaxis protein